VEGAQAGAQGSALPTIGGGEIVQGDWPGTQRDGD